MGIYQKGAEEPRSDHIQSGKPGTGSREEGQRPADESHSEKVQAGKPGHEQSQ